MMTDQYFSGMLVGVRSQKISGWKVGVRWNSEQRERERREQWKTVEDALYIKQELR